MQIRRLTPKYPVKARNFTNQQAETRVFEFAETTKELQRNAISVHGSSCVYFKKILHGDTCTCHAKPIGTRTTLPDDSEIIKTDKEQNVRSKYGRKITIDYSDPLFTKEQAKESIEQEEDVEDDDFDANGSELFSTSLFGNAIDCGICYRTGNIPAYVPLGHSRYVWHTHNVESMEGYTIDSGLYPSAFTQQSDDGFVEFRLQVPSTYVDINFAVYNNKDRLNVPLYFEDRPLVQTDLSTEELVFRIKNIPEFTHIVMQFQLVQNPILIDFPQNQRGLDLTMFDSLGAIQLVTSDTVPTADSGDVILNLDQNTLWKVTDYNYYELRDGNSLGWNLNARLIQKDETLINIGSLWGLAEQ